MNTSPRELLDFFQKLHQEEEVHHLMEKMEGNDAFADLVFEYIWLCRSDAQTINLLNSPQFTPSLLVKFIYFGFGKQFLIGNFDSSRYFNEIKSLLNSEQSLRVLSEAESMEKDPTLKIHLLANLDPKTWEAYFDILDQNSMTLDALLGIFSNLRDNEIKKILLHSPTLYYYLQMMILSESVEVSGMGKEQKHDLKQILDAVHIWDQFCSKIKENYQLTLERGLSPRERDSSRISAILREIISVPEEEREDILAYLKGNGILLDEVEESTLSFLLKNYKEKGSFL
nr:hypothetical protein [Leptospira ryugenii]